MTVVVTVAHASRAAVTFSLLAEDSNKPEFTLMPPSTVKAEVAALSSIVDALEPLPQASRSRVLQTAGEWLSTGGASDLSVAGDTKAKPKQMKEEAAQQLATRLLAKMKTRKKPRAKRQQFGMRKQAKKSTSSDAPRGDRLVDRCHAWLTEQDRCQNLLAIAEAVRSTRVSVYQAIRKDDRFVQVARGEWGVK